MTASESDPATTNSNSDNSEVATTGNGNGNGSPESAPEEAKVALHPHHVSKLLDEVLDEPEPPPGGHRLRHPMVLDLILGVGLLVAMGGFTIGLFKMYVVHSAQQSIFQHNYK